MGTTDFRKYDDIERYTSPEVEEIFSLPEEVVCVEEKVDGGNGSMFWDSKRDKVMFASRNKTFEDTGAGNFQPCVDYIKGIIGDGTVLNKDYVYYYEQMIKHTIRYDLSMTPRVLGLDIYSKTSRRYLNHEEKTNEFKRIGIPNVRLIGCCKFSEIDFSDPSKLIPQSAYYSGPAEGIVIKNYNHLNKYGRPLFAKIVSAQFKEMQEPKDRSSKEYQDYQDTNELVDMFVTEARIRKQILKLINEEQKPLDRGLMKFLPNYVIKDVFKEEIDKVIKCDTVYLKHMRGKSARMCLDVLDRMIYEKDVQQSSC